LSFENVICPLLQSLSLFEFCTVSSLNLAMSCVEALPTFYAYIAAAIVRRIVRWKMEGD